MKKILVICRKSSNENIFFSRIKDQNPELEISMVTYPEVAIYAENDQTYVEIMDGHVDLASFDLVFFKTVTKYPDMAAAISSYLDNRGVKYIDTAAKYSMTSSKLYQYVFLANNGVFVPPSIYVARGKMDGFYSELADKLKLPFVLKDTHGYKGKFNFVVNNESEFKNILSQAKNANIDLIAQGYIENDGDYRVLVFGEKVYLVILRQGSRGSHLNNISTGGKYKQLEVSDLPAGVIDTSIKAAKVLDRQVAGVDMVMDKITNKWFCFEVNDGPQISSGAFVEEKAKLFGEFLKD
jgi:glutathione synthase/RimK-type ligase-like ATP-grasp enzyme